MLLGNWRWLFLNVESVWNLESYFEWCMSTPQDFGARWECDGGEWINPRNILRLLRSSSRLKCRSHGVHWSFWMVHPDAQILGQRMMMEGGDWINLEKYSRVMRLVRLRSKCRVRLAFNWSFWVVYIDSADFGAYAWWWRAWLNTLREKTLRVIAVVRLVKCRCRLRFTCLFLSGVYRRARFCADIVMGGLWLNNYEKNS